MANMITAEELRALSTEDLQAKLKDAKEELFNLRFQAATGQLESHGRLTAVRKEIASRAEREAAALAQAKAGKSERPRRAPRAPRGEVTTSSVEERAQESAPAATAEVTTEVKSEGGEA